MVRGSIGKSQQKPQRRPRDFRRRDAASVRAGHQWPDDSRGINSGNEPKRSRGPRMPFNWSSKRLTALLAALASVLTPAFSNFNLHRRATVKSP
jgi:hypothetical protein